MVQIVSFSGAYDLSIKQRLRNELNHFRLSAFLVLDLTAVTYADSTLLSELVVLEAARRSSGFQAVIVVAPENSNVKRILDVGSLASAFRVVDSLFPESLKGPHSSIEYADLRGIK